MVPNRCIWCRKQAPAVSFNVSHVLPECVGNKDQHVLPPGIVCTECNAYFGSKVEPILLDDPFFHLTAVVLRLVDPEDMHAFRDRVFDKSHPPVATPWVGVKVSAEIVSQGAELNLDIEYTLKGRLRREYDPKRLALLSRAVHKIAFESLAWNSFVKGLGDQDIELFSPSFDPVVSWARYGQPQKSVRPVLRRLPTTPSHDWTVETWRFDNGIGVQLNLFGDWYVANLTSDPSRALADLQKWEGTNGEKMWCITETLSKWPKP